MNIVYIHGNGATGESFNFIRMQLTGHNEILLEYDSIKGFYNNYQKMLERAKSEQTKTGPRRGPSWLKPRVRITGIL